MTNTAHRSDARASLVEFAGAARQQQRKKRAKKRTARARHRERGGAACLIEFSDGGSR